MRIRYSVRLHRIGICSCPSKQYSCTEGHYDSKTFHKSDSCLCLIANPLKPALCGLHITLSDVHRGVHRIRQNDRPQSLSLCSVRHNHTRHRRSKAERSMLAERNKPAGEHNSHSFCGGDGDDGYGADER